MPLFELACRREARALLVLALASVAGAQQSPPPPSVADWAHPLETGAWLLSLRGDFTEGEGLRDAREDLSRGEVFGRGYSLATDELNDRRTTLRIAHGLAGCSVFAALPLVSIERSGQDDMSGTFDQDTTGIGDLELGVTKTWHESDNDLILWSLAASLPTGSIDDRDDGQLLPYPMQPGSGTLDIYPGAAWTHANNGWDWGVAIRARINLGLNTEHWSRSNSLVLDTWIGAPLASHLTGRLGLRNSSWGDLHGAAEEHDPSVDPLADDERQGGNRTDLLAGLDWAPGDGDVSFALEVGVPVDEWLDGPQVSTDLLVAFGLRYGF